MREVEGFYCVVCECWTTGEDAQRPRVFELRAFGPRCASTIMAEVAACARHERESVRNALARELAELGRAAATAADETGATHGGA